MKSYFPDVNVWIALAYAGHQHSGAAHSWFDALEDESASFSRVTQLSFLRLLTHPMVMGKDWKTEAAAWKIYDLFLSDSRVLFRTESDASLLESTFRRFTSRPNFTSKQWPDAYLAAFAETAGLILVTFDRALHQMSMGNSLLLN